ILSHFDADHVNGVAALLDFFVPARCLVPCPSDDRPFARELLASLRAAGCRVLPPRGEAWPARIGAFDLAYSTSTRASPRADNDHSIVARGSFGSARVLLTGDIGAEGVDRVVRSDVCDGVDVMFLPHHGMSCAGLPRLIKRIQPRWLVLSGEPPRGLR